MILYHFTNVKWLEQIVADGVIKTTDSNLSGPSRAEAPNKKAWLEYRTRGITIENEPKVVWLTNLYVADPGYLGMVVNGQPVPAHMVPAEYRKTRVRITVAVPDTDALWWPQFARHNGRHAINERWYRMMARDSDPKTWFVVLRPIPMEEITTIELDDSQVWPGNQKLSRLDAVKAWLGRK